MDSMVVMLDLRLHPELQEHCDMVSLSVRNLKLLHT